MNQTLPVLLDNLFVILDQELERMQQTRQYLNDLRAAVVKRDEHALQSLLKTIQAQQPALTQLDQQRDHLRSQLAVTLGCPLAQMNLTRLSRVLHEPKLTQLKTLQDQLQKAARSLKNEHRATNILLKDCARFNRMLIKSLLGKSSQTETYDASGKTNWQLQRGLVNIGL